MPWLIMMGVQGWLLILWYWRQHSGKKWNMLRNVILKYSQTFGASTQPQVGNVLPRIITRFVEINQTVAMLNFVNNKYEINM